MFAYSRNPDPLPTEVEMQSAPTLSTISTVKTCIYQNILKNIHEGLENIHNEIQIKQCNDSYNHVT